ncbi:DUF4010 domain-containing protein [Dyella sp. AtDHG13]|uniref:MgtC/SapB family protein n=1 Tax=Dyella sp. AtDHG13 TaxID=1938897 RepID=UPI001F3F12D0|nr:DUF4010 domain-containing protein [Dyella sp. AtDHG13]
MIAINFSLRARHETPCASGRRLHEFYWEERFRAARHHLGKTQQPQFTVMAISSLPALSDIANDALGPAVGLAMGLLIGLERERSKGRGPSRHPAGVRTFSMIGLTGAAAGLIGPAGIYISGAFLSVAMAAGYLRTRSEDPGLTTEVAMLLTFLLGVLALSSPAIAGSLGIVATIFLASKDKLHHLSRRWLTAAELQDFLILLACAFVVLPLLPDAPLDPWGAINPRRLWILVVAIMAIATLGYLALRVFGTRFGLAIAGMAGGFVSSTATVLSMADRAATNPQRTAQVASAAVMSNVGTVVQFAVVVGSQNQSLLEKIALPLLVAASATVVAGFVMSWRSFMTNGHEPGFMEKHPFDPVSVLKLVTPIAAVMLLLAMARAKLGAASMPWMTAVSALADVHAAAAAVAQAAATGQIDSSHAILYATIAMVTNGAWKCVVAFFKGSLAYGIRVASALALINGAFVLATMIP